MKAKIFSELKDSQVRKYYELPTTVLLKLKRLQLERGICRSRSGGIELCKDCEVAKAEIKLAGWSGPMACSIILLELASRGYYQKRIAYQQLICDQCGMAIKFMEEYVPVKQFGYKTLNFCMNCVRRKAYKNQH